MQSGFALKKNWDLSVDQCWLQALQFSVYELNGNEFEKTLGDSEGQGSLVCCSPQDHKELDTT